MDLSTAHTLPQTAFSLIGDYVGAGLLWYLGIKSDAVVSKEMSDILKTITGRKECMKHLVTADDYQVIKSLVHGIVPFNYIEVMTHYMQVNRNILTFSLLVDYVNKDDGVKIRLIAASHNRVDCYNILIMLYPPQHYPSHMVSTCYNLDEDIISAAQEGARDVCNYILDRYPSRLLANTAMAVAVGGHKTQCFGINDIIRFKAMGADPEFALSRIFIADKKYEECAKMIVEWMDNKVSTFAFYNCLSTGEFMWKDNVEEFANHISFLHSYILPLTFREDGTLLDFPGFTSVDNHDGLNKWYVDNGYT